MKKNEQRKEKPRLKRSFDKSERTERNFDKNGKKARGFDKTEKEKRSFNKDGKRGRSFDRREEFNKDKRRKPAQTSYKTFDKERRGRVYGEEKTRKFDKTGDKEKYGASPRRRKRDITAESPILSEIVERRKREGRQTPRRQKIFSLEYEEQYGPIRLNKYIANSGICSRRDADMLIQTGAITVNGVIVTELGTKVMPTDEVRYGDKILQREKPVYLLLNKPKDYITTMDDERDRKHVIQLVKSACKERIYPVGRLDKNTTGLLLFTNDGEMTKKLTHPKHGIRKIYHVELDRNLKMQDFNKITEGIELNDGLIIPDEISYVGDSKKEIGITLHSGKNRVVRRIFESLNYQVVRLDRVVFAGLTKKDLPRGEWRFLTREEINILKMSL